MDKVNEEYIKDMYYDLKLRNHPISYEEFIEQLCKDSNVVFDGKFHNLLPDINFIRKQ